MTDGLTIFSNSLMMTGEYLVFPAMSDQVLVPPDTSRVSGDQAVAATADHKVLRSSGTDLIRAAKIDESGK